VAAVESAYMKERLVESNARRLTAIETGGRTVVGVNAFLDSEPSPLTAGGGGDFLTIDPAAEAEQIARLDAWRRDRDSKAVEGALAALTAAAAQGVNVMEPSIACAKAGVTTGEWAGALRRVYGEYRAPTGLGRVAREGPESNALAALRSQVDELSQHLGRPLKMLVGKPGLDGHSNGAEQIAVRARGAGFHVVYPGIRLTPAEIARAARDESVHVVGLSVLSGSHVPLVTEVLNHLAEAGLADLPVVVGGIVPTEDAARLEAAGVVAVFTPKDYDLTDIMARVVQIAAKASREAACA
jgi:(2R)-ethylmalonyl-CoA mutase